MMRAGFLLIVGLVVGPCGAHAQDATLDDKLRELLRQSTTQLRTAQDNAAALQASLDAVTKQRDQLQQQVDAAKATPPATAAGLVPPARLAQTQAALATAHAQTAQLAQTAQRLQAQIDAASAAARTQAGAMQRSAQGLTHAAAALSLCRTENSKLASTGEDILHLYETPQFRTLLVANHERLLGFARVHLENLVQDYEDKIAAQTLTEGTP